MFAFVTLVANEYGYSPHLESTPKVNLDALPLIKLFSANLLPNVFILGHLSIFILDIKV
jgi:hypothetical protein